MKQGGEELHSLADMSAFFQDQSCLEKYWYCLILAIFVMLVSVLYISVVSVSRVNHVNEKASPKMRLFISFSRFFGL